MKVKFLSEEQIENSSFALLAGYGREFGEIRRPPIPVEEILESHLKLRFDFADLPRLMGKPGVLGAIWIPKRCTSSTQMGLLWPRIKGHMVV
jgi:hypothetical protein